MVRRALLAGALWAAWMPARAASAPDPLAELPRTVRKRLVTFEKAIERHDWPEAVGYFDPSNHAAQHKILFSLEHNADPLDPGDSEAQAAFTEWYILGALGLWDYEGPPTDLDDVTDLRFGKLEKQGGPTAPVRIRLDIDTRVGPRPGILVVDPVTGAISGPPPEE